MTYSGDAGELYFPRRRARKEHQGEIIGGLFASLGLWWATKWLAYKMEPG